MPVRALEPEEEAVLPSWLWSSWSSWLWSSPELELELESTMTPATGLLEL